MGRHRKTHDCYIERTIVVPGPAVITTGSAILYSSIVVAVFEDYSHSLGFGDVVDYPVVFSGENDMVRNGYVTAFRSPIDATAEGLQFEASFGAGFSDELELPSTMMKVTLFKAKSIGNSDDDTPSGQPIPFERTELSAKVQLAADANVTVGQVISFANELDKVEIKKGDLIALVFETENTPEDLEGLRVDAGFRLA